MEIKDKLIDNKILKGILNFYSKSDHTHNYQPSDIGIDASASELSYCSGLKENIQEQINNTEKNIKESNETLNELQNSLDFAYGSFTPNMIEQSTSSTLSCENVNSTGYWVKIGKLLIVSFFWSGKPSKSCRICIDGLYSSLPSDITQKIKDNVNWYAGGGHIQNNKLDANREFTGWIYSIFDNRIYGRNRNNINIGADPAGTGGFEEHNSNSTEEHMSGTIAIQLI